MNKSSFIGKEHFTFDDLVELIKILRSPDGCPWDRTQTHRSIRNNFLEEAYEAVEGIDLADAHILREELGDVLLQVLLHAEISEKDGEFSLQDVLNGLGKKLVYRHPHVFGEMTAENEAEALDNWDALKRREKGQKTSVQAVLSVASSLPALMRAQKLSKKAAKNGLWKQEGDITEHLSAFLQMPNEQNAGRILFEIVAMCGAKKIDAEQALFNENRNFCEQLVKKENIR